MVSNCSRTVFKILINQINGWWTTYDMRYTRFLQADIVDDHKIRLREITLRRDGVAGKEKTSVK